MATTRTIRFTALLATSLLAGAAAGSTALATPQSRDSFPPRLQRYSPPIGSEPAGAPVGAPGEVAVTTPPAGQVPPGTGDKPVVAPVTPSVAPAAAAAWGENYFGLLGTLYRDRYEASPVGVEGLSNITQISVATAFNLALLSDGTVVSWGGNSHGQLGNNENKANWEDGTAHVTVQEESLATHQAVGSLHGVKAIAAANQHALVLMKDGTVMAWGNNEYGQLGDGQQGFERILNLNERLPKVVPGLTNIKAVAAGGGADYAITAAGTVMAWGMNTEGQLGLGQPGPDHCETGVTHYPGYERCSERPLPVMRSNPATGKMEPLSEVKAVYAGQFAAYALLRNGHVVSWGGNHSGELGTGSSTWQNGEFPVSEVRRASGEPLSGVLELGVGYQTTFARLENGEVLGWGNAAHNGLAGTPTENCRRVLVPKKEKPPGSEGLAPPQPRPCLRFATRIPAVEALHPQALAAGDDYGLALSDGTVYSWGSNQLGQLGIGRTPTGRGSREALATEVGEPTPVRVEGIGPATAIAASTSHAVALLKTGVAAPPPLVAVSPGELSLGIAWRPETTNGREALVGERLLYRVFEHSAETEAAEQGSAESEEGPPLNLASEPPHIALMTLDGEPLGSREPTAGDRLRAELGGWSGARPITFSYQWQRCSAAGESCISIAGAKHPVYLLTAQDAGSTLRVLVTASGPVAPADVAASAATELVAAVQEGERGQAGATSVHLQGPAHQFVIERTLQWLPNPKHGRPPLELAQPLQAVPYEVRFSASGNSRVMVLTPLPAAH